MKRTRLFIVITALTLALLLATLPYRVAVEHVLKDKLKESGITNVNFTVDSVGLSGITLKDITLAAQQPLSIDQVTLDYSILDLLSGTQFKTLALGQLKIKNDAAEITANNLLLSFAPTGKPQSWQGSWTVESLVVEKSALPLPPLAGSGGFNADMSLVHADGDFKDAANSHKIAFDLNYGLDKAKASQLKIVSAYLPWNEGTLSVRNAIIPLGKPQAFRFVVNVQRVSLDALMQLLTGSRAKATGAMTGAIPVLVDAEGNISVSGAELKAEKSGTIMLQPDAIPGDNEQVELVRTVLTNFHYIIFSLGLETLPDDKLSMLLQLSGNNPDVYNGREVRLNVRLNGDLLNLLKQNIMPLADPAQLLKESTK